MNFFARRRILKKTNAFDLIPVRRCDHKIDEDGKITILVPKFRNPKVARFMLSRKSNFISMHLDANGSYVWLQIDGVKSIQQISEEAQRNFGETFEQAGVRVNKFMSRLYEERYITFRQLEEGAGQSTVDSR